MLTSSLLFSGIAIIVKVIAAQVACRIVVGVWFATEQRGSMYTAGWSGVHAGGPCCL